MNEGKKIEDILSNDYIFRAIVPPQFYKVNTLNAAYNITYNDLIYEIGQNGEDYKPLFNGLFINTISYYNYIDFISIYLIIFF